MLKRVAVPFMFVSLGVFSAGLLSVGCGSDSTGGGTGGAGGHATGGTAGHATGGTPGTGGTATGGTPGTGGTATGGTPGTGGTPAGGAGGHATGGTPGTGGAAGGAGGAAGSPAGGAGGKAAGGAGGVAAGGTAGSAAGGAGGAALKVYSVTLNGAMDGFAADAGVTGTGTATVTLNTVTGDVSVNGTYMGLTGAATAGHIHGLATPPASAGIIVPLTVTAGTPDTSGTLTGSGTLNATNLAGMLAGMTYLNIHTAAHTGGEIRGNIGP